MKTWLSLLGICALLGGLLSSTYVLTKPMIQANRSAAQRAALTALVAPQALPATLIWEQGYLPICAQLTLESLVANGYGGPMTLLMTYQPDACTDEQSECGKPSLKNLVVSQHAETPGIGDFFETTHSQWLQQLVSIHNAPRSTEQPIQLDSISGATITVTALQNAVAAALNVGTAIPFTDTPCELAVSQDSKTHVLLISQLGAEQPKMSPQ